MGNPDVDPEQQLPRPVLATSTPVINKKTTFETGMRVHWARFKKRIGNGSAPSESLLEGETTTESSGRRFMHHTTMLPIGSRGPNEDEEVDEIVVDNAFVMDGSKSVTQGSEPGITTQEKSSGTHGTHATDRDSYTQDTEGLVDRNLFLSAIRYRFWPVIHRFFFIKFHDPSVETHYQKEIYYQGKGLRVWGGLFFVLNWVLVCILIPRESIITADRVFYYGICPALTLPLPLLVIYDIPRSRPTIWQAFMTLSLWSWAYYLLILIQLCGTYNRNEAVTDCKGKEFLGVFYYTGAVPVIGLFAMGQNRLWSMIGGFFAAGLMGSTIRNRNTWIRNFLNFVIYMMFLLLIHYQKESSDRRLYTLRDQLKIQYRATQKAQVSERKAADSKKRFSSYIFHEVRVPLNTALLAVQNMEANGIFNKDNIEFTALEGSLNMMSKVLNDVLDFNRMDSGRFESVAKPYAFHKVIKGILVPLRLAASARELELVTELDPMVDIIARQALYRAKGESESWISRQLENEDDIQGDMDNGEGFVVGDEHRLRQVVTNLASNACKFTPPGGKIYVRTKLIYPSASWSGSSTVGTPGRIPDDPKLAETIGQLKRTTSIGDPQQNLTPLSATQLDMHNSCLKGPLDTVIIRMEVEDTGVGIRRKDMIDNRLFSPYVQTDIGRFQGGKGTGLGLALSKHIVRLSGGRLGVKSKLGMGSIFWVELAVGVGTKVLEKTDLNPKEGIIASSMALARTTTEAFKLPEGEGETPSTMMSASISYELRDPTMPQATASAIRQLMEHSGQIELLPTRTTNRHGDRSTHDVTGSFDILQAEATSMTHTAPPSPTTGKRFPTGADIPTTSPPSRIQLPHQQQTFMTSSTGSAIASTTYPHSSAFSADTIYAAPFTPPISALVVDDDHLTRKLMARMLTRLGCTVQTAENGMVALEMLTTARESKPPEETSPDAPPRPRPPTPPPRTSSKRPRFDIIFLDNQMPMMSGVELVQQLRSQSRHDFVVGVTGNAMKEDQKEYMEAGVDHVLTKPVLERSIKSMLKAANERRQKETILQVRSEGSTAPSSPTIVN